MKKIILGIAIAILIAGGVFFATADTKEEKAVKSLATARELVAQGDDARARVELRNALKNDETLRDARILLAELLDKAGRRGDAFAQYRQLYERNPQDADAARALAGIAFDGLAWDDARKYVDVALAARPDDPELQAISRGIDYRSAAQARDTDAMDRIAADEAKLLAKDPTLLRARRVLLANEIRRGEIDEALQLTDDGLALTPDDRDLNNTRLVLLDRLNRNDDLEKQLLSMISLYPKDEELRQTLVRFYLATGRVNDAEQQLRGRIDPNGTDSGPRLVLLRFLSEVRSPAVMREELEKVLAQNPLPADVAAHTMVFRALKAQADFVQGDRDKAMADMEGLIKDATPSAEVDRAKIELARMRVASGNTVGARALVEEVLARDPGQTEAIKMKSAWLIDEDKTDQAVSMLRDALADAPNDAQVMTLLARAYQREGRPELMSDMLARAVEVSNQAPAESLQYAGWLFQQAQFTSAETVLIDALRRQPNNLDLLTMLARTHLAMEDWGRTRQDIAAISDRLNTDASRAAVNELQAQLLSRQGRNDELGQFLEQLSRDNNSSMGSQIAMIRNTVASGKLDQAMTEAEALAAETPDAPAPRLLLAQLELAMGKTDEALTRLQALTRDKPDFLQAWLMQQAVQLRLGRLDDALATINTAQQQFPDQRALSLAKAFVLEKKGDIGGAIAIYDALYTANTNDPVVANNLASLLASTHDDQESLDRAWTVARRLNGSPVPAFQDTYGWISFRRGDAAQALPVLEKAAKGLPNDPAVAYHLGRAYAAQNRMAEAKAEYDRADALLAQGAVGYPALAQDLVRARADLK